MRHKTDLSEIKRVKAELPPEEADVYRGPPGGVWVRRRKRRRFKATLVDERKERILFGKWILTYVVAIPLCIYTFWWFLVLVRELFFFSE